MPFADKLVIVYLPAFEASLLPQPAQIPTEANETDEIAITFFNDRIIPTLSIYKTN